MTPEEGNREAVVEGTEAHQSLIDSWTKGGRWTVGLMVLAAAVLLLLANLINPHPAPAGSAAIGGDPQVAVLNLMRLVVLGGFGVIIVAAYFKSKEAVWAGIALVFLGVLMSVYQYGGDGSFVTTRTLIVFSLGLAGVASIAYSFWRKEQDTAQQLRVGLGLIVLAALAAIDYSGLAATLYSMFTGDESIYSVSGVLLLVGLIFIGAGGLLYLVSKGGIAVSMFGLVLAVAGLILKSAITQTEWPSWQRLALYQEELASWFGTDGNVLFLVVAVLLVIVTIGLIRLALTGGGYWTKVVAVAAIFLSALYLFLGAEQWDRVRNASVGHIVSAFEADDEVAKTDGVAVKTKEKVAVAATPAKVKRGSDILFPGWHKLNHPVRVTVGVSWRSVHFPEDTCVWADPPGRIEYQPTGRRGYTDVRTLTGASTYVNLTWQYAGTCP